MGNVFDYLKWRDDISLDDVNEIDALILSRLSYIPFEEFMSQDEEFTLYDIYQRSLGLKVKFHDENDERLFRMVSLSQRYGNLAVKMVVNVLDEDKEEQFTAITIRLSEGSLFISFRGTTSDIIGWKEDFNMAYMDTPSQRDAVKYLNDTSGDKLYVGGHSKGGNLAVYGACFANEDVKRRIVKVYNFDGPGLLNLNNDYEMIKDKIITYMPSDAIVGRIFSFDNARVVVKSNKNGIREHDLYSWNVQKNCFVLSILSKESDRIKGVIDEFLDRLSLEDRKLLIDNVYDVIRRAGIKDIGEIDIGDLRKIVVSYKSIDSRSKELFIMILRVLYSSAIDNFMQ